MNALSVPSRGRWLWPLLAALLVAAAVRVNAIKQADNIATDGTVYLTMAHELAQGHTSQALHSFAYHPGYPSLIAVAAGAVHADWPLGWVAAGQWVSLAMSLAALFGLFFVARAIFDQGIALLAVLFFGLSEEFIRVGSDVLSDGPAMAMVMAAVALGFAARNRLRQGKALGVVLASLAGLASGAGYLMRPEELLAAAIVLGLLVVIPGLTGRDRRLQAAAVGALVLATLACVLPYAMSIGALTHKKSMDDFTALGGGGPMLAAMSWPLMTLEAVRRVLDRLQAAMGVVPLAGAIVCWASWLMHRFLRVKLPASVMIYPSRAGGAVMAGVVLIMFPLLVTLELNRGQFTGDMHRYISSRHALLMAMFLMPCAAAGLLMLAGYTSALLGRLRLNIRPAWAFGSWLVVGLACILLRAFPVLHEGKGAHLLAGLAIHKQSGAGQVVYSGSTWEPFFAQSPTSEFTVTQGPAFRLGAQPPTTVSALLQLAAPYAAQKPFFALEEKYATPAFLAAMEMDARVEKIGRFVQGSLDKADPKKPTSDKASADKAARRADVVWVYRMR